MRRAPLRRRTPLTASSTLARTGRLERHKPLERNARIQARPRRQPVKSPWPMTCPPGFWEQTMQRAGYRCQRCGGRGGLTLSHRLDRIHGGPFTDWNIDVLCMGPAARSNPGGWDGGGCHDWRTAYPVEATPRWRVSGELVRGVYHGDDDAYRELVAQALVQALETTP